MISGVYESGKLFIWFCQHCEEFGFTLNEGDADQMLDRHIAYDVRCPMSTAPRCHHRH